MKRERLTTKVIKRFPILYSMSSKGKVKQWSVEVIKKDNIVYLRRRHGYYAQTIQIKDKEVLEGKNIGKSNETTVESQAILEAESLIRSQRDANYTEDIPDKDTTVENLLPMKAQNFKDRKHKIVYPCYIQPKMNGVRCLASVKNDGIDYTSKTGKPWLYFQHLTSHIFGLRVEGNILDGEIFNQAMHFQDITSYVKKRYPETERLQLWVYDIIISNSNDTFEERWSYINARIPDDHPFLVKVPTYLVQSEEEIEKYYKEILAQGFEGAIIRNAHGLYRKGYRSVDLQKYKPLMDAEFEIIGGHEGKGTFKGCCIFECTTKDGVEFSAKPKGSRELLKQYWKDLPNLIGKMLTVEFECHSKEGRPLKPIGIVVRDYE